MVGALRSTGASIKFLDLSFCEMGPGGLEILGEYLAEALPSTLHMLAVEFCSIGDEGFIAFLPRLAQCSRLRVLDISGNDLTKASLQGLVDSPLPGLTQLVVNDNDIDEDLLFDLRAAHPNTEVVNDN